MNIHSPTNDNAEREQENSENGIHECDTCEGRTPESTSEGAGTSMVLGDFLLESILATGGMAKVWRGRQLALGRPVAIKVCDENGTNRTRLEHESLVMSGIDNPQVPHVYAWGVDAGFAYMAMELLTGASVVQIVNTDGPFDPIRACRITASIAEALHTLWNEMRLVHCDVKPENVLLTGENEPKLIDFGLAKLGEKKGYTGGIGDQLELVGSPYYISPEQILGQPPDHRSDLYSLGIMLYYMLTGKEPFQAKTSWDVASQHLCAEPPPLDQLVTDLPAGLPELVCQLLEKNPDERLQDGKKLSRTLERIIKRATMPRIVLEDIRALKETEVSQAVVPQPYLLARDWNCSVCTHSNTGATHFCARCGTSVLQPCPFCEEDVHSADIYCPQCGGDVACTRESAAYATESLIELLQGAARDSDATLVKKMVRTIRERGLTTLPPAARETFNTLVARVMGEAKKRLEKAREELKLDRYEQEVELLSVLGGEEAIIHHKQELKDLKSDLARRLYQANAAFQAKCFSRCLMLINETAPWTGSIAARREDLITECRDRIQNRDETIEKLGVMESIIGKGGDIGDAITRLAELQLSRKVMVVAPAPEDLESDARAQEMLDGLYKLAQRRIREWMRDGSWQRVARVVRCLRAHSTSPDVASLGSKLEKKVDEEVEELHAGAVRMEGERRLRQTERIWKTILEIPADLVPSTIRQKAKDFPLRKPKILQAMRKPRLRRHATALLLLWCLTFGLTAVDLAVSWLREELTINQSVFDGVALALQFLFLTLGIRILHTRRKLQSDDLVPRVFHSSFDLILCILWIVSPASVLLMAVSSRISVLFGGVDTMFAQPAYCGLWIGMVWMLVDLGRRRPLHAFPESMSLTLSWLLAYSIVCLVWPLTTVLPFQIELMAIVQAIFFLVIQAISLRTHRTRTERVRRRKRAGSAAPETAVGTSVNSGVSPV